MAKSRGLLVECSYLDQQVWVKDTDSLITLLEECYRKIIEDCNSGQLDSYTPLRALTDVLSLLWSVRITDLRRQPNISVLELKGIDKLLDIHITIEKSKLQVKLRRRGVNKKPQ